MIPGLEILNLHAQGGMAEVYRARGRGADGLIWHYAVKRILPELTQDPTLRAMFVEEARVASMLVHPNIVRVYDLARGDTDDYYIVMEFLEGRDLAEAMDKAVEYGRMLPVWFAIHVAREVLHALMYATTTAVDREGRPLALIHRDISPHNIFICADGQVKLTDFGVAKVAQSNVLTQVGVTKGKFGYMSPEQLMSEKLDFRSDLYNVGIQLYESLTCRRLFNGDNASQFLQSMLSGNVPALDPALRVPPELDALMRRALSRDRNARPPTAAHFDEELRQIAERYGLVAVREHVAAELRAIFGAELVAPPPPPQAPPPPQQQQRPSSAPKSLASVSAARPAAVARVPSRLAVPVFAAEAAAAQAAAAAAAAAQAGGWGAVPSPSRPGIGIGAQQQPPATVSPVVVATPSQPTKVPSVGLPQISVSSSMPLIVTPSDGTPGPFVVPAQQQRTRGLHDSGEIPVDGAGTEPMPLVRDRPLSKPIVDVRGRPGTGPGAGGASASGPQSTAPRASTRSVRQLPDKNDDPRRTLTDRHRGNSGSGSGAASAVRSRGDDDDDDALPSIEDDDPVTVTSLPRREKTAAEDAQDPQTLPPEETNPRRPTVVARGAGAKPLASKGERSGADDDWNSVTATNEKALPMPPPGGAGVVRSSQKVVPLASSKKNKK